MKVKELIKILESRYDLEDYVGRCSWGQDTGDWYELLDNELVIRKSNKSINYNNLLKERKEAIKLNEK